MQNLIKNRFVWPVSEVQHQLHAILPFPDVADSLARAIRNHRAGGFAIWKPVEDRPTSFFEGRWFRRRNDVSFELEFYVLLYLSKHGWERIAVPEELEYYAREGTL